MFMWVGGVRWAGRVLFVFSATTLYLEKCLCYSIKTWHRDGFHWTENFLILTKVVSAAGQPTEVTERSNLPQCIAIGQMHLKSLKFRALQGYFGCQIIWWHQFQYCAISSGSNRKWIDISININSNRLKLSQWGFSMMPNSLALFLWNQFQYCAIGSGSDI